MDYSQRLRRLSIDDERSDDDDLGAARSLILDDKTRHLVRLAALIAVAAAEPSIHREVDDAISAGASNDEIVAVLDAVVPIVGRPRVTIAAPRVALALGEDLDLLG